MTCQLGATRLGILEEALGWRSIGEEATYWERLKRISPCTECGVDMTSGPMIDHRQRLHGIDPEIYWDMLLVIQQNNLLQVYEVRFPEDT